MSDFTLKSLIQEAAEDVKVLAQSKLELYQLKWADKGASAAAGGAYGIFLFINIRLCITLALICGALAFSLLFIENQIALETIKGILFGSLCMLGVLFLFLLIALVSKKRFKNNIKGKVINQVIDQLEEEDKKRLANKAMETFQTPKPYPEDFIVLDEDSKNHFNE